MWEQILKRPRGGLNVVNLKDETIRSLRFLVKFTFQIRENQSTDRCLPLNLKSINLSKKMSLPKNVKQ